MSNERQLKQRQLDNERILLATLRGAEPKAKSKIQQLRSDVNDIAHQNRVEYLRVVR